MSAGSGANAPAITIRRGTATDREFVVDLGGRTTASSISTMRPAPLALVERNFVALVDHVYAQPHVTLVAEQALGPVGFLLLMTALPDEVTALPQAFVAYMAVEPHARRRGVAARLLAEAEHVGRELGLGYLSLMVTEENAAARELYAQAGFATERRLLCRPI